MPPPTSPALFFATWFTGQPALVVYERTGDGRFEAHGVQVLTLLGDRIARITAFNDLSLVPTFGLAPALTA